MSVYYLDTSAALKLLAEEAHSKGVCCLLRRERECLLDQFLLLRFETIRAVTRVLPAALPDARDLLLAFDLISIDDDIVDAAMNEADKMLCSLDAIHLATARVLGSDLTGLTTYDDRLASAASDAGLPVISPRDLT